MSEENKLITIDGPSGAGKSTISRMVAEKLNYTYLDTGAMYRAVGLKVERSGIDVQDNATMEKMLDEIDLQLAPGGEDTVVILDGEDVSCAIRTAAMGLVASRVSAIPVVRDKLTVLQRKIGGKGKVVAEGRDMGTVVFPDAASKFYLDAAPAERARRRTIQLQEKGQKADFEEILAQIIQRDADDSSREMSPLKPAADAVIIDSSNMSIAEVVDFILQQHEKASDN